MFLKNNSVYLCGIRTRQGVKTIKPGDAIYIYEADLLDHNDNLTVIDEAEYEQLKNKEVTKSAPVKEPKVEDKVEDKGDEKVEDKGEDKGEDKVEDKVEDKGEEKATIEKEIKALKLQWTKSRNAKQKESLQKKIMKLQEQLEG